MEDKQAAEEEEEEEDEAALLPASRTGASSCCAFFSSWPETAGVLLKWPFSHSMATAVTWAWKARLTCRTWVMSSSNWRPMRRQWRRMAEGRVDRLALVSGAALRGTRCTGQSGRR